LKSLVRVVFVVTLLITSIADGEEAQCTFWERHLSRDTNNCTPPTARSEEHSDDPKVTADVTKVAKITAEVSRAEQSKLIRQEFDPKVYSWSEVEFRFCLAYESCRISRETYEALLQEGRSTYRDRDQLDRIDTVLKSRRITYEGVRFTVSDGGSATVGKKVIGGGGKKRGTIKVVCPAFAERTGDAALAGAGGCYALKDIPNGASARGSPARQEVTREELPPRPRDNARECHANAGCLSGAASWEAEPHPRFCIDDRRMPGSSGDPRELSQSGRFSEGSPLTRPPLAAELGVDNSEALRDWPEPRLR
jgi:hypothetical protein